MFWNKPGAEVITKAISEERERIAKHLHLKGRKLIDEGIDIGANGDNWSKGDALVCAGRMFVCAAARIEAGGMTEE